MAPIHILLVEDNPGDVRLVQEALKENRLHNTMDVAKDGEQAIAYLQRRPPFTDAKIPDLILLDLNLPRVNGHEVLDYVKDDSNLRVIPVVVMTSSDDPHDISRAYSLHANCYVTKPLNLDKFLAIVKEVSGFWLSIVKLPPHKES